jgi:hypothetical protein
MFKSKNKQSSLFRQLRSIGPKHRDSSGSAVVTGSDGDTAREEIGESLPAAKDTANVWSATDLKKPMFSDVLNSLIPRDIVEAIDNSGNESFTKKVKELGMTTWMIFKQVLRVVEAASPAFPPLQGAAGGLLNILERCDVRYYGKYYQWA